MAGDPVKLTTDGGQTIGTITDNGDGTYTADVTSTKTAGTSKLTATDGSVTDDATLTQVPGPVASVALKLDPASITADGNSHTTAKATVEDVNGNPITGDPVTLDDRRRPDLGTISDNGDGTYTADVTSTKTAGTSKLTATDGSVTDDATLTQVPGPAASVDLKLDPASITADGNSHTTAKATVEDVNGNPITGDPVTLATDGGQGIAAVSDNSDGTYTADVTSTTTAGTSKLTATDGSVTDVKTLTQTPGPVASVDAQARPRVDNRRRQLAHHRDGDGRRRERQPDNRRPRRADNRRRPGDRGGQRQQRRHLHRRRHLHHDSRHLEAHRDRRLA